MHRQMVVELDSYLNARQGFQHSVNPFVPNAPFLYPLKILRFSDVFRGERKGALQTNGLKT